MDGTEIEHFLRQDTIPPIICHHVPLLEQSSVLDPVILVWMEADISCLVTGDVRSRTQATETILRQCFLQKCLVP